MHTQPNTAECAVAAYLFHEGTNARAFAYLGSRRAGDHFCFRVWAPEADGVSVCGDFNGWNTLADPMQNASLGGVWELFVPDFRVHAGQCYKYCIRMGEKEFLMADPYAVRMQAPPDTASIVCEPSDYRWRDRGWLRFRKDRFDRAHVLQQPIHVYELHVGSWKKKADGSRYTWSELATELAPYLKQMGYTHVQLMPVTAPDARYAPNSAYGSPEELMQLVDAMHEGGVGVILDWAFDSAPFGECSRSELACPEVQSFWLSNAVYWIEQYHIDGLHVSTFAKAGAFLQRWNDYLAAHYPDVLTIAEGVGDLQADLHRSLSGWGFSLCRNAEWVEDLLEALAVEPEEGARAQELLKRRSVRRFSERDLLALSHKTVACGKKTLIDLAKGDYETKFARVRSYLTYMMTYPGKKLTFMGCEIGAFRAWECDREAEWFLTDYEMHRKLQLFAARLNRLYLSHSALWQTDADPNAVQWLALDGAEQEVIAYQRCNADEELTVVLHTAPTEREGFLLKLEHGGEYEVLLCTDDLAFGGKGLQKAGVLRTVTPFQKEGAYALLLTLPPTSATVLRRMIPKTDK